jgi:hypothetical protein
MTEQNRSYVIWLIKGLAEQEYGPQYPITKNLASIHEDAQRLLRRHSPHTILDTQGLIPKASAFMALAF